MNVTFRSRRSCRLGPRPRSIVRTAMVPGRFEFPASAPTDAERLAGRLLARALRMFPEPHYDAPLRRAACEAIEAAETAGFVLLVFPELFSEIAVAAMLCADYKRLGRL